MSYYSTKKEYYCGVDLHANTIYLCILNNDGEILFHQEIKCRQVDRLSRILKPYKHSLVVAAESCFAWYWLADFCEEQGIEFILGHALYMKHIHGGKVKNDRIDSEKIARLVQSGFYPTAYVYPKEKRGLRDLLRRRLKFVRIRSQLLGHVRVLNYQDNNPSIPRLSQNKKIRSEIPDIKPTKSWQEK